MSMLLAGQVALVTGGTSGIGKATAALLARHGASVAIIGRSQASVELALDALTHDDAAVGIAGFVCDLADETQVAELVERVRDQLGRLDILVNCAAAWVTDDILTADITDLHSLINTNFIAPFLLIQSAGRVMVDQGDGGRIVNVVSSSAFRAAKVPPGYAGTKAALAAVTRSASATLGPFGINVNAVAPGMTATPMTLGGFESQQAMELAAREGPLANLLGRMTQPEDVADTIVYLCLPGSRQITGQVLHVSAGAVV
jgi:NAD(P)-dependent dehydrogenase (short-subunit alcohol dehydrogenase family)